MTIEVLIVDDSTGARMVVERTLRAVDREVGGCHHARDGQEALAVLEKNWIDVIITDLHMPGMSGRELIRNVRAHDLWKTIPVAVITSERGDGTGADLADLGADSYHTKPLQPEDVAAIFLRLKERMP